MAKNGNITGAGTNAPLIALVAPASPAVGTLGDVAFDGLGNYAPTGLAIIDFGRRKVGIAQFTADNIAALDFLADASAGADDILTFEMSDITKSSAIWTAKNGAVPGVSILTPLGAAPAAQGACSIGAALNDRLGYGQSAKSSVSLISAIEDALAEETKQGVLVINQNTKIATLYIFEDTTDLLYDATAGFTNDDNSKTAVFQATFTQVVESTDPTVPKNVFAN